MKRRSKSPKNDQNSDPGHSSRQPSQPRIEESDLSPEQVGKQFLLNDPQAPLSAAQRQAVVLRLQKQQGNRYVSRLLSSGDANIQLDRRRGRKTRNLKNKIVLRGTDKKNQPIEVRTTREVLPITEKEGSFSGYDVEIQAIISAQRHAQSSNMATVVVKDGTRFRVFETNRSTIKGISSYNWNRAIFVRWAEPRKSSTTKASWSNRVKQARQMAIDHKDEPLKKLFTEATGLSSSEVKILRRPPLIDDKPPPNADSGKVNLGLFEFSYFKGIIHGTPDEAKEQGDLTSPYMVIGWNAWEGESPEPLRATVAHEARHIRQGQQIADLITEWRDSLKKRKKKIDFYMWLIERHRKGKIPDELYWVAKTSVAHPGQGGVTVEGGTAVSELLAHAEGFVNSFHYLMADDKRAEKSASFKEALDTLTFVGSYYGKAKVDEAKNKTVERLQSYVCSLESAYRKRFKRLVDRLEPSLSGLSTAPPREYWIPFVKKMKDVANKCQ